MLDKLFELLKIEFAEQGLKAQIYPEAEIFAEKIGELFYPHLLILESDQRTRMLPVTTYGEEIFNRIVACHGEQDPLAAWNKVSKVVDNEELVSGNDCCIFIPNPDNEEEYLYIALLGDHYCDLRGKKIDFLLSTDNEIDSVVDNCINRALQKVMEEEGN